MGGASPIFDVACLCRSYCELFKSLPTLAPTFDTTKYQILWKQSIFCQNRPFLGPIGHPKWVIQICSKVVLTSYGPKEPIHVLFTPFKPLWNTPPPPTFQLCGCRKQCTDQLHGQIWLWGRPGARFLTTDLDSTQKIASETVEKSYSNRLKLLPRFYSVKSGPEISS